MVKTFKLVFYSWLFIFTFFSFLALNLNYSLAAAPPAPPGGGTTSATIELQLSQPFGTLPKTLQISSGSIGVYIKAAYEFTAAAIVGLAIVMIIIAGIEWITAGGDGGKIGQAKDRMIKAFTGLFIALFAVFILRTVSPKTVEFAAIDAVYINPGVCCQLADKTFTYTETADLCTAKPGKVTPGECGSGNTAPTDPRTQKCTEVDGMAHCQIAACDTATQTVVAGTDLCPDDPADTTKINCCHDTKANVCDKTTPCPNVVDYYCAANDVTNITGVCVPMKSPGADCSPANIIKNGEVVNIQDGQCKRGVCFTTAEMNKLCSGTVGFVCAGSKSMDVCVPGSGTGQPDDYCTDSNQCASGHCYNPTADSPDGKCTVKNLPAGSPCDNSKLVIAVGYEWTNSACAQLTASCDVGDKLCN